MSVRDCVNNLRTKNLLAVEYWFGEFTLVKEYSISNILSTFSLMWLEIYTTPTTMATIITDIGSQMIFPAGWCESNNYPLTAPQLEMATPSTDTPSTSQHLQNIGTL